MDDPGSSGGWTGLLAVAEARTVAGDLALWVALALVVLVVAAETAIRNFRWSRLEELVQDRDRLKRLEEALRPERSILDGLIVVRLLGSCVLILAMLGLFAPDGGAALSADPSRFRARLLTAFLVFVIGLHGVVRGIARAIPERSLLALIRVATGLWRIVSPIVWFTDVVGRIVCRAIGLERQRSSETARHQILDAVSVGERGGAIDDEGREMIENIIEVQDQEVSEVMTPRTSVFAIPVETPLDDAVRLAVEQGHSRVPVFLGTIDNVIGILYTKDLLAFWQRRDGPAPSLKDVLRKPVFVPETKKANDLMNELRRDQVHLAIVLDEYGGMSGMVTIEDLLEEIVGEIRDEYDQKEAAQEVPLVRVDETTALVLGTLHIDDLNKELELQLPEDEAYDTVAGFISTRLGRVPATGEICILENLRFEILAADQRRIHKVKLLLGSPAPAE